MQQDLSKARVPRVLIVDDHAALRELMATLFEAAGCQVWLAEDGFEAVKMAALATFDVVLMDRNMPRCGGDQAARAIRQSRGLSRNAMIVSHSTEQPMGETTLAYDRIVAKPMGLADIASLVETLAAQSSQAIGLG